MSLRFVTGLLAAGLLSIALPAQAQMDIGAIRTGVGGGIPIAVIPFRAEPGVDVSQADVAEVISNNLDRSGDFRAMARQDILDLGELPTTREEINFATWRQTKRDYLVTGRILPSTEGLTVDYQLYNTGTGDRVIGYNIPVRPTELRAVAHFISDQIYKRLTNIDGVFSTKLAYVSSTGTGNGITYRLMVADADGYNPRAVDTSREPFLSPAWSPDGRKLAYVTFESRNSAIAVRDTGSLNKQIISSFRGINGAPAFSPDSTQLAFALSRTGNLEINVMDLASRSIRQLTNHWQIDTEPSFSADGQRIYFTSDRGGKPQIYEVGLGGGAATRVTFNGEYNAKSSVSPDGRYVASVMGEGNVYKIAVLDRGKGNTYIVSTGNQDESPSFAPNGRMIAYASKASGTGQLFIVSTNGRVRTRLATTGSAREPAWGPLRKTAQ
jgi:TolB protein